MTESRILLNVPLFMTRRVLVQDASGAMVPDRTWHDRVLQRLASLHRFLIENNLLVGQALAGVASRDLVITEADLTGHGVELWRSGAVNRWLASFDKSPSKSPDNWTILVKALRGFSA